MKNIVVFAYKSNSTDYCQGCVMDRYDSNFEYLQTSSVEEAVEFVARFLFANMHMSMGEYDYEVTILADELTTDLIFTEAHLMSATKQNKWREEEKTRKELEEQARKNKKELDEKETLLELTRKYGKI